MGSTPKSSIFKGLSFLNNPFGGIPIVGNPPVMNIPALDLFPRPNVHQRSNKKIPATNAPTQTH